MPTGTVMINDVGYAVSPFALSANERPRAIHRSKLRRFPEQRRAQGAARQADLTTPDTVLFGPPIRGFGLDRVPTTRVDDPEQYEFMWDADADIQEDGVRLPLKKQAITATGLERCTTVAVASSGAVVSLWEDDTGGQIVMKRLSGSEWIDGGEVEGTSGSYKRVAIDIIDSGGALVALYVGTGTGYDHKSQRSTNTGGSWAVASSDILTVNLASPAVTAHAERPFGMLIELAGGDLAAVIHDNANDVITVAISDDGAASWTNDKINIKSRSGPLGAAVYHGPDEEQKLYILSVEGLWEVETVNGWSATQIWWQDFQAPPGKSVKRLATWDSKLWIAPTQGNEEAARLVYLDTTNGQYVFREKMGLNKGQGVPADMVGGIDFMKTAGGESLLLGLGGYSASTKARIVKVVRLADGAYSILPVVKHDTANQRIRFLASGGSTIQRICYGVHVAADDTDTFVVYRPFVNANVSTARQYELSGYVEYPRVNGGMPATGGAWLQAAIEAEDLSATASGEHIDGTYGIDGAARTTTAISGDFLSGDLDRDLAATRAGTSGKSLGLRLNMTRDGTTDTDTPVLVSTEVSYQKKPAVLEEWVFRVDLDETAASAEGGDQTTEDVITALETAEASVTNVKFEYGNIGTKYVDIEVEFDTDLESEGDATIDVAPDTEARRTGFAVVTAREVY